jgi:hypothetical protein
MSHAISDDSAVKKATAGGRPSVAKEDLNPAWNSFSAQIKCVQGIG